MPGWDVAILVLGVQGIVFSRWWGRGLATQSKRSAEQLGRDALFSGAVIVLVALVDYSLLVLGFGSPIGRLIGVR